MYKNKEGQSRSVGVVAHLVERQTEVLKVPGSIPGNSKQHFPSQKGNNGKEMHSPCFLRIPKEMGKEEWMGKAGEEYFSPIVFCDD